MSTCLFSQHFAFRVSPEARYRPSPSGAHPRGYREAGEEAQNSRPRAQRLGHHHGHRPEGDTSPVPGPAAKTQNTRVPISAAWPGFSGRRCDGKKQRGAIDRRGVERRHGGTMYLSCFFFFHHLRLLNFPTTRPVIKCSLQIHNVLFTFSSGPNAPLKMIAGS